mgnify:CR=1 FL=1
MTGVVKLVPVPKDSPPVGFSNQLITVPGDEVAPRFTVPGPQRVPGVLLVSTGVCTVTVTTLEYAGVPPAKEQATRNR